MDIMIDIETLGLGPRAAITQIGAVAFDPSLDIGQMMPTFRVNLGLQQQLRIGREIDESTLLWWMSPEQAAARRLVFDGQGLLPGMALSRLTRFVEHNKAGKIWARGPQFDITTLTTLYGDYGMPVPWTYRVVRDSRTVLDIAGEIRSFQKAAPDHVGDVDAWNEACSLILAVEKLRDIP